MLFKPRGRCGCGEIGIRGGLKIRWGFPRCRFESGQPHHCSSQFKRYVQPSYHLVENQGLPPSTRPLPGLFEFIQGLPRRVELFDGVGRVRCRFFL